MDTFYMDTVLEPMLAILAIFIPIGFAYITLLWKARNLDHDRRNGPATTRDGLPVKKTGLSGADKKYGAR